MADRRWLAPQPLERALALPALAYLDADVAHMEQQSVLRRGWQLVAHRAQLAAPGDAIATEAGGVPLVLTRDGDGVLHALVNVCRHRAGPLLAGQAHGLRALVCRYHGWSYALDGRLRGVPGMQQRADFDVAAIGLPRAHVHEWRGLVFAAAQQPATPFAEWIAGIDARLDRAGHGDLASYRFERRVSYEVACNWKVYVENYLEGYHLPLVHPGLARALDVGAYRVESAGAQVLQWSPLDRDASITRAAYGAGEALYWWLYPATMLNVLPGRLQTNRVVPLALDRCRVDFDYFYPPETLHERIEADVAFAHEVQAEDEAICAAVQRGLASGTFEPGPLNPQAEAGLHHFHELWRAALVNA